MTNVLDRLALRAIGALPVVRPVPPPRFAAAPTLAPPAPARTPFAPPVEPGRQALPSRPPQPRFEADAAHGLGAYLEARRSGGHERL